MAADRNPPTPRRKLHRLNMRWQCHLRDKPQHCPPFSDKIDKMFSYVSPSCGDLFRRISVARKSMLPSRELTFCELERSTMLLMGKSTISMAIFNCFLYVHQRVIISCWICLAGGPRDCIAVAFRGRVSVDSRDFRPWMAKVDPDRCRWKVFLKLIYDDL